MGSHKNVAAAVQSLSGVQLFERPRTIAHQAPLSRGSPRQECWSELPFSSLGWKGWRAYNPKGFGVMLWRYWNTQSFKQRLKAEILTFSTLIHPSGVTFWAQGYSLLSLFNFLHPPCTKIWRLRLMLCVTLLGQECRDCRMMTAFGRGPEWKIYLLPCRCLVRWAADSLHLL